MPGNKAHYLSTNSFIVLLIVCLLLNSLIISGCQRKDATVQTLKTPWFTIEHPAGWQTLRTDYHYSINGPTVDNYVVNMKLDFNPEANMKLNLFRETVESQNQITLLPGYDSIVERELLIHNQQALQRIIKTDVLLSEQEQVSLMVMLTYLVKNDQLGVVITAEVPVSMYLSYNTIFDKMIHSFRFR
jgi:hypothetical protein